MKKILLPLLLLCLGLGSQAQHYTFSHTTGTFSFVTGGMSVFPGATWNDDVAYIPIGFTFNYMGTAYDSLTVEGNGSLFFGTDGFTAFQDTVPYIIGFGVYGRGADLIDRGSYSGIPQSPVSKVVTGIAPNRICKIEWENAGLLDDPNFPEDSISFQIWLYEGSNNIEIHIGPRQIKTSSYDGATGPSIGLGSSYTPSQTLLPGFYLSGSSSSPTIVSFLTGPSDTPAEGTIYRFTPSGVGIEEPESNISFYPNPVEDNLYLKLSQSSGTIEVYDLNGRMVAAQQISTENIISFQDVASGMYLVKITTPESEKTVKIQKL